MHFFYLNSRTGKYIFFLVAILIVGGSLWISNSLVQKLEVEEHKRMAIWAEATRNLASTDEGNSIDLILTIIESNTTIPVIVVNDDGEIAQYTNIEINDADTTTYLQKELANFREGGSSIEIDLGEGYTQTLYYGESVLLKQLSYFPYIQIFVLIIFFIIAYVGLISSKRAEQNKVWVGLSKETAHQLGTPISSLMAWIELLKCNPEIDPTIAADMDKDVKRLSTIAERFSKIGSMPDKELIYIHELLEESCDYMSARISNKVQLTLHTPQDAEGVMLCRSLMEWVIENLCKNSVDAMGGEGKIDITLSSGRRHIYIDVKDTGKGIARKDQSNIFKPGYTTKKRGWGLGLTLAKRIVEEYHNGQIYVKESEIGVGTTIRIEIPKVV